MYPLKIKTRTWRSLAKRRWLFCPFPVATPFTQLIIPQDEDGLA
jgi:hypothetical protein